MGRSLGKEPAPRKAPENRPRPRRQGRRGRNRGPVASGAATGNASARGFATSSLPLKRRRREHGCRRRPTLRLARARPRLRPARAPDTEPGARPEDAEARRTAPGRPRPPVVGARRPRARGGLGQASRPPRGTREPRRGPRSSSAGPSRPEQAEPRTRRREAPPSNPPRRGSPRVAAAQDSPGRYRSCAEVTLRGASLPPEALAPAPTEPGDDAASSLNQPAPEGRRPAPLLSDGPPRPAPGAPRPVLPVVRRRSLAAGRARAGDRRPPPCALSRRRTSCRAARGAWMHRRKPRRGRPCCPRAGVRSSTWST